MRGRIAWKRRIGQLYAFMRARDARRTRILLYHSFGGNRGHGEGCLRDQLGVIAAMGQLASPGGPGSAPAKARCVVISTTAMPRYGSRRDDFDGILALRRSS